MGRIISLLTLLGILGCASSSPGALPASPIPEGAPLTVQIEPYGSAWVVHTNRAVSVALFEILPNRGAGLLFPNPDRNEGQFEPGSTQIQAGSGGVILRHRAAYLDPPGTGGLVTQQNYDFHDSNAPVMVLAIACECELDLEAMARPDGPRNALGSFSSLNAPNAASALAEAILPSADVQWTTARYFPERRR